MIHIKDKVVTIMNSLPNSEVNPIDYSMAPIPPFKGNGDVKLIIIGQDPTIRNRKSRENIKCTLNLDKSGALKTYIKKIVFGLGFTFENVYATNLFKYFYNLPPQDTFEVLNQHLLPNLELLKEEISEYPDVPIITLGEPVLQLLSNNTFKVRNHWDYNGCGFHHVLSKDSQLNRDFYPFIHIGSYQKVFYKEKLPKYIRYMNDNLNKTKNI